MTTFFCFKGSLKVTGYVGLIVKKHVSSKGEKMRSVRREPRQSSDLCGTKAQHPPSPMEIVDEFRQFRPSCGGTCAAWGIRAAGMPGKHIELLLDCESWHIQYSKQFRGEHWFRSMYRYNGPGCYAEQCQW